ncbi:MAG TPA: hypothetical protein V6C52_12470 [Coleofasciculaceae cyanobacterium]
MSLAKVDSLNYNAAMKKVLVSIVLVLTLGFVSGRPSFALELSPNRNVAVSHTHYLEDLYRCQSQPWLYQPLTVHSSGAMVLWEDLITIQNARQSVPALNPGAPVIRITSRHAASP